MEILRYDYDGKKFVGKLEDKKIKFGIEKEDGSISEELTEQENFAIRATYNFVLEDENGFNKLENPFGNEMLVQREIQL